MKKATKVFTSLILVGSMCMSLTSCFGASKAVKEAATEFMEAALERDIDDMADLCTDDDEAYMYLGAYVTEFDPVDALLERAEFSIGKITVKKGTRKGLYTLKVKIRAKGTTYYKPSATKTVTVKIRVK